MTFAKHSGYGFVWKHCKVLYFKYSKARKCSGATRKAVGNSMALNYIRTERKVHSVLPCGPVASTSARASSIPRYRITELRNAVVP